MSSVFGPTFLKKAPKLLRRWFERFRWRSMGRLGCRLCRLGRRRRQGQNLLTKVLFGCLQCRNGLRHLVLLAGELILIGSELLYAAPDDGKINGHGFKLLLHFCGRYSRGGRGGGCSPRPDHLRSKRGADTDENRNQKESKGARYSPAILQAVARERITLET